MNHKNWLQLFYKDDNCWKNGVHCPQIFYEMCNISMIWVFINIRENSVLSLVVNHCQIDGELLKGPGTPSGIIFCNHKGQTPVSLPCAGPGCQIRIPTADSWMLQDTLQTKKTQDVVGSILGDVTTKAPLWWLWENDARTDGQRWGCFHQLCSDATTHVWWFRGSGLSPRSNTSSWGKP